MPVKRVKGGYKWGEHGHVFSSRAGAEAQARAAYANGYRGDGRAGPEQDVPIASEHLVDLYTKQ